MPSRLILAKKAGGKMAQWKRTQTLVCALAVMCMALINPTTSFATVEGDQTLLTDEEIAAAVERGQIEGDENPLADLPSTMSNSQYSVITLGGSTRYDTSAQQALYAFPSSRTAIVASGDGWADAIGAAGLAGALDCPIVLTESHALTAVTHNALSSMGVKHIILLGGQGVSSLQVENDLKTLVGSDGTVTRLGGIDRYATQMAVYSYGVENNLWSTNDYAIVASGEGFADALSISPVSFALKAPVFFCDESHDLSSAIWQQVVDSGKSSFLLTGGTGVTSAAVEQRLQALGSVVRLGGNDRYKTSASINSYALNNLGFTANGIALSSGTAPFDSLGGGPVQGRERSIMVLQEENDYRERIPWSYGSDLDSLKFFGGLGIYSMAFKTKLSVMLGFDLNDIEGFKVYIDAGHGQNNTNNGQYDPGASGSGYQEATLTQDLANRVAVALKTQYGLDSYVNTNDWYKLRQTEAVQQGCGLFVSIHFNSLGGTGAASGTESYIHPYNASWGSEPLQQSIHSSLVGALGLPNRGMKQGAYAVCGGKVPAVLLEICFIDRASDINQYISRRDSVANAIASGIARY